MTIQTFRGIGWISLVALILSWYGCGGSGGPTPTVNDQLFVPNYVTFLEGLYHWDHLPMRVVFYLPSNWQELYPSDRDLYIEAVNEWNQEGKQALIAIVAPGSPSDAAVTFVRQADLGGTTRGRTEAVHDSNGVMKSANIKIALDTPWGVIAAGDARATIAHELGHALGINGHSPYPEDLMYSAQIPGQPRETTVRDLNTVMTAYPSYFIRALTPITPRHLDETLYPFVIE